MIKLTKKCWKLRIFLKYSFDNSKTCETWNFIKRAVIWHFLSESSMFQLHKKLLECCECMRSECHPSQVSGYVKFDDVTVWNQFLLWLYKPSERNRQFKENKKVKNLILIVGKKFWLKASNLFLDFSKYIMKFHSDYKSGWFRRHNLLREMRG